MTSRRATTPNLRNVCVGDVEHVVFVDDAEDVGGEKLQLPVAVALGDRRPGEAAAAAAAGGVDAPQRRLLGRRLPRQRIVLDVIFVR